MKTDAQSARILLAEDNVVSRTVAIMQLKKLGHQADAVQTGREAVTAQAKQPYGLILMDCEMPDMDGFEATKEIRRTEGPARRTPIVAMTASGRDEDRQKCVDAGMDDFITKPVNNEVLRSMLDRWLAPRDE